MDPSNPKHLYCISGLGADFRIFQNLRIENVQLHEIRFPKPTKAETLASYAKRLISQIHHERPLLIGVSFGGMLAAEIASSIETDTVFLVSTCKSHTELPPLLQIAGFMRLHKVVPYWWATKSSILRKFIFDTRSTKEELFLKGMMLNDTHFTFIKQSVDMILNWRSQLPTPSRYVQIHGTHDRLLTPSRIRAQYWVRNAGHFMIWNRAEEISNIINNELKKPKD